MSTPYLSQTFTKILLQHSPLHAWTAHPNLNPNFVPEEKTEFDLGRGAHAALLEHGRGLVVVNPEDFRSKPTKANPEGNIPKGWTNDAIREARDTIRAEGNAPILPWDKIDIDRMVDKARQAIAECADLSGLTLDAGDVEHSLEWEEGDVIMRSRLDWVSKDKRVILDYKSTTDATPAAFSRQIAKMGYHIQDAFYCRGIKARFGTEPAFVFLAQENKPPYACSFHGCDPALKKIANDCIDLAVAQWRECVKTNRWPGYSNRLHWAGPTNWQLTEHEERVNDPGIPYEVSKMWETA